MAPAVEVAVAGRSPLPARAAVAVVLRVLAREHRVGFVSLTFVGRDRMRALHRRYKGRSQVTDVLAFVLNGPGGRRVGDVYVCPWVAVREARRRRIPIREELVRLVVHGTLHVLGYEHPDDESRTGSPMWRRQERYVAALR